MSSKKQSNRTSQDKTEFIISLPVQSTIDMLMKQPQLHVQEISSVNQQHDFEVYSDNKRVTVYVSIKMWNYTDTLVIISPLVPFGMSKKRPTHLFLFVLFSCLFVYLAISSKAYVGFVILWFGVMFLTFYNYRMGAGISRTTPSITDDIYIAKEKLINSLVEVFTKYTEVQAINY